MNFPINMFFISVVFFGKAMAMRRTIECAIALVCLMLGYGWVKNVEGADPARGKALYEERCMLCHGPKGDGKGPGAVALNPKPANYTLKKFWEQQDIEKIIPETIKNGKGQMRASADLTPDDIESIILYMKQTFKPK
jgi:mono/diheme cytochrome c family protein